MAEAGDRGARRAQRALADLDRYISGTQLGITLASLALGWIGEPALAVVVDRLLAQFGIDVPPGMAHTAAGTITAFMIITFLHIVLGELAPKSVALVMPERISGLVALPLMAFSKVMSPFIWVLNGAATGLLATGGYPPDVRGAPRALARGDPPPRDAGPRRRDAQRDRLGHARRHLRLCRKAGARRHAPTHRDRRPARRLGRGRGRRHRCAASATRAIPVYDESLDDIVGVFLSKDLWLREPGRPFVLREHLRDPLLIPASRSAERVLDDLRRTRAQMAVVLDEFGGTAGIITMEDLIEEVIGDIADEYDMASRDVVEVDGVLELSGSLSLVDVRSDHRLPIPEGEWTTLGGYVFARLGHVPKLGERASYPGGELEVMAMDKRRVAAVRVHRTPTPR
ncbi:MAG: HlyC/CorC family transporter [Gemmatimonadetes bacterium]|nr:HlyC/CorC family transporter [Gemmatimonadota bacterium]